MHIFYFLPESSGTDTEDSPDQTETGVKFNQIKNKNKNCLRTSRVPGTVLRLGIYGARQDCFPENLSAVSTLERNIEEYMEVLGSI